MKSETNYYYYSGVDVDYDTYYPCQDGDDCCKDDYCRCGTIQNTSISINFNVFTQSLADNYKIKDQIGVYGVNRIATIFKMYDPANWEVMTCGGYYGEEIDGAYFNNNDKVVAAIKEFKPLDDAGRIEFLLNLEYARVPAKYRNRIWKPAHVRPDEVSIGNSVHLKRSHGCPYYEDYPFFVCLALKTPKGYDIVDGYHRYSSNIDKDKILILAGV